MTLTVESACTLRKTVTDRVFNHGVCCSWKAYHTDTQRVFVNQFAGYTQLLTALFVTKKSQLKNAENLEKDTSAHKNKRIVFYGGKWKTFFKFRKEYDSDGYKTRGSLLVWSGDEPNPLV